MTDQHYVAVCAWDTACLAGLMHLGREIADQAGLALRVLLFVNMQRQYEENAVLLEYAFQCAKRMDAEMNAFYTDEPMEKLSGEQAECLIMLREDGLTGRVRQMLPEKRLVVMEQEERAYG